MVWNCATWAVFKRIRAIKELTNVASNIVLDGEYGSRVKGHEVRHIKYVIVKNHKFLTFLNKVFKLLS